MVQQIDEFREKLARDNHGVEVSRANALRALVQRGIAVYERERNSGAPELRDKSLDEWRRVKAEADASLPIEPQQIEQIKAVCREMIETVAPNDESVDFDEVFKRVCRKVVVQGIFDMQCWASEADEINAAIVRGEP